MMNLIFCQSNNSEKDFESIKEKIYPIIKVEASSNQKSESEMIFQKDEGPIFEKLGGDLLLFYGIDKESHYQLITSNDLPESINPDSLRNIAVENLVNLVSKDIELSDTNFGGKMLICGYNFECALILIDWL